MTATCAEVAMRAGFIKLCLSNLNARPSPGGFLPKCPVFLRLRGDRWRPVDQGRESPYGHSEGKIGNAFEMHSIIKSGLIRGGEKPQKGQAVSVFSQP